MLLGHQFIPIVTLAKEGVECVQEFVALTDAFVLIPSPLLFLPSTQVSHDGGGGGGRLLCQSQPTSRTLISIGHDN